jgi:DnaJ homolog subfamily C member 2
MVALALPPIDPDLKGPVIYKGTCTTKRQVEPVGDTYELYLMRRLGLIEESESENEQEEKEEGDKGDEVNKDKLNDKRKKANKDDIMKKLIFKNHYHALGLEEKQTDATIDDIRKAYKIKVMSHHPDKFEEGAYDDSAKAQWLSVRPF